MIRKLHFLRNVLRAKNAQIKSARDMAEAQKSANVILSAYVAILAKRQGEVRIPKSAVSEALGRYRVSAEAQGDCYVITVHQSGGKA
ncbi:MAG: hypothetical protein IJC64_04275 [Clostridia bacterium]|nr:hypothetical protein [Clostridia bacterium]